MGFRCGRPLGDIAAHDHVHQSVVVNGRGDLRPRISPIAEYGDTICVLTNLVHAMGDEQDAHTCRHESAQHLKDTRYLASREENSWLVQDQDPRLSIRAALAVRCYRSNDGHERSIDRSKFREALARVEVHVVLRQKAGRVRVEARPVDERRPAREGESIYEQVFADVQARDQAETLMNEPEASAMGIAGAKGKIHFFAEEAQGSGIGDDDSGEHLNQRALTGAILAQQPVDFAGCYLELGSVEGQRATVPLGDSAGLEQCCSAPWGVRCLPGRDGSVGVGGHVGYLGTGRPQRLK